MKASNRSQRQAQVCNGSLFSTGQDLKAQFPLVIASYDFARCWDQGNTPLPNYLRQVR